MPLLRVNTQGSKGHLKIYLYYLSSIKKLSHTRINICDRKEEKASLLPLMI